MFAAVTALFFATAAGFAVFSIARAFAGGAQRIDALFAQYRAMEIERPVRGEMRPAVQFTPAPPPVFAARKVVALPRRASVAFQFRSGVWRAAA